MFSTGHDKIEHNLGSFLFCITFIIILFILMGRNWDICPSNYLLEQLQFFLFIIHIHCTLTTEGVSK